MDALIASILEKTLVGGAFIYLLHYFVTKFSATLERISHTLERISNTLLRMDIRFENLEKRVDQLEKGEGTNETSE